MHILQYIVYHICTPDTTYIHLYMYAGMQYVVDFMCPCTDNILFKKKKIIAFIGKICNTLRHAWIVFFSLSPLLVYRICHFILPLVGFFFIIIILFVYLTAVKSDNSDLLKLHPLMYLLCYISCVVWCMRILYIYYS